jgi:polyphosphate glucokinase
MLGRILKSRAARLKTIVRRDGSLEREGFMSSILVVDIGGNSVKVLVSGETDPRKFPSGPTLTPRQMVSGVKSLTEDWHYDVVSIGFPGRVRDNRPTREPHNLGHGWPKFDFGKAFGVPVKVMNDAAMQALGSYRGGTMLFLGLGTGLGTALVADGRVVPMELGHLSYKRGTYEDYLGLEGLKRLGIREWRDCLREVVARFITALELDDVVIGGGNINKVDKLPPGCRAGGNALAFCGGFLLWGKDGRRERPPKTELVAS